MAAFVASAGTTDGYGYITEEQVWHAGTLPSGTKSGVSFDALVEELCALSPRARGLFQPKPKAASGVSEPDPFAGAPQHAFPATECVRSVS